MNLVTINFRLTLGVSILGSTILTEILGCTVICTIDLQLGQRMLNWVIEVNVASLSIGLLQRGQLAILVGMFVASII